jgi:two-component system, response regulator
MGDRFQRMRLPALPTVLFADASEDYRAMASDALLEGRNATDMRLATDGPDVIA